MRNSPTQWQLPPGVSRGLWDYIHSDQIADDYDDYFAFNRMFEFDEPLVLAAFRARRPEGVVADLGCGTGRVLMTLCQNGYQGLAVDLSQGMLDIVQEKADLAELPIQCLRANMVELDCLANGSVDHAVCMFSTLGMIRGRSARRKALSHVARVIKPGGGFVVHVHNFWFNAYDPRGFRSVAGSLVRGWLDKNHETGDRFFHYRGVANMYLHVFRRRELMADLQEAGLQVDEVLPLAATRDRAIRMPWLFPSARAHGWIAICTRP